MKPVTKTTEDKYNYILDVCGVEYLNLLVAKGKTLYIADWIKKLSAYLNKHNKEDTKKIAFWMAEQNQQLPARLAINFNIPPVKIWATIQSNSKLQELWANK